MDVFLETERLTLRRFAADDVHSAMRRAPPGPPSRSPPASTSGGSRCTRRDDGPPDDVELGYRLLRSAWVNGYATEGSRALIDKAFTELGAQRVFAETMR